MNNLLIRQEQIDQYHREGYLLPHRQVFEPARLAELSGIFEEHLAEKGDKLSDELDKPHLRDSRLLDFLLCDEVLDLVEPLIGPNIGLWSSHFICKEPYTGRATPWHEDSAYWDGKLASYDNIVTVWLAIDPTNKENGCMRVIPGTHHNGFSEYVEVERSSNTFDTEIKNVDEEKAVYFELARGECSLHDSRIIHGAKPNTSPYRRCGYTMRYFAADIEVLDGRQLWLARGSNIAGNSYVNA